MAFVDEIKLHMKAGNGGDGVVRWRHEKGKDKAGAAGGNGGKGGDIYARAVSDIGLLAQYRHVKEFVAENGDSGAKNSMHGRNGNDLFVDLPVGSLVTNLETGKTISLDEKGQTVRLLIGGRGGLGNEHFKASTNVRPMESTLGREGEEADFEIELLLIAEIGLVGLPNAGKSSLLNALTSAKAKVGSYAFTTLEPNLGDMYGHIIADIPGLIEGAAEGKGLGHKFLRHIKRTKLIAHCISLEEENLKKAYDTVRDELEKYDKDMDNKNEIIILTKSDLFTPEEIKKKTDELKPGKSAKPKSSKINKTASTKIPKKEIIPVSIIDDVSIKALRDRLIVVLN